MFLGVANAVSGAVHPRAIIPQPAIGGLREKGAIRATLRMRAELRPEPFQYLLGHRGRHGTVRAPYNLERRLP